MQSIHSNRQLVVVLGMHRSGTSAITRALQTLGVALGERLEPPAPDINAKGYWEDIDLVRLNVEMLQVLGHDWDTLEPIQLSEIDFLCDQGYLSRALQLLHEKMAECPRFGFKDPRTCKLLPFWERVFHDFDADVRYVLALRNPISAVKSLERRDGFDPEKSFLLWAEHIVTSVSNSNGRPIIPVDYDRMLQDPARELGRLAAWLGTEADKDEFERYCSDFLDTGLRHSLFTESDVLSDSAAAPLVRDIYAFIIAAVEGVVEIEDASTSGLLERWRQELERMRPALRLLDKLQRRLSASEEALATATDTGTALSHVVEELNAKILLLTQETTERGNVIDKMRSSTSWRVTAPMRTSVHNIRRAKRAVQILPRIIARGGGLKQTTAKGLRVIFSEGLAGILLRLRYEGNVEATQAVETDFLAESASKLLRVVPHYVDPRRDAESPVTPISVKVAVHVHLLDPEMAPAIAERLSNIPCPFDLYVSVSKGEMSEQIAAQLKARLHRAVQIVVENVPNRGCDLAPLIVQFGQRLAQYDVLGHFHATKAPDNSGLDSLHADVFDVLLGPCGSSGGRVQHLIQMLTDGAKVIYPEVRRELSDRSGWAGNYELARQLLERHSSISIRDFPSVEYPEDSMFWARPECLKEFLTLPLTFDDFLPAPIEASGTIDRVLVRLILIFSSPYEGHNICVHAGDSIRDYRDYELSKDFSETIVHGDVKVLSYYLPQFHPIPENDAWHGKGFTEWTKVRAANPLFRGHYQQHIPHEDIGYYLLDGPDTLRQQADLMRRSGVHGQIFYHYWFGGKLILEEPALALLDATDIKMPFCFCWANENWTRRWDGNESEILLAQNYSLEDARAFIRYLIPFFKDARHITIDGRPVLFVYRPASIPDIRTYLDAWADECHAAGLAAPYVVAVLTRGAEHPGEFGMDAGTERVLHDWTAGGAPEIKGTLEPFGAINGSVLSYEDVAKYYTSQTDIKEFTYFRSIVPMWDNTARYASEAFVIHGSTPERFQGWLEALIQYSKEHLPQDRRFVLINAWNEWAEGAHLEPDTRHGYAYLNSVGRALSDIPYTSQFNAQCEATPDTRLHLSFPASIRELLANDRELAKRFLHCLSRSSVLNACSVTADAEVTEQLLPEVNTGTASGADFILEIRRISFFSPDAIEKLVRTAAQFPESVIIANAYDGDRPLIGVTRNGSIEAVDAYDAPLLVYPGSMPAGGFKNYRMRTDSRCFVAKPNSVAQDALPIVTTIIRFHKSGEFGLLRNALSCLAAMHNCICVPLIAAQDLSPEQLKKLRTLLDDLPWWPGHPPRIDEYKSPHGNGDLRSMMLTVSLKKAGTRYVTFLDYDDLVMSHGYDWLVNRLDFTGKAVTFGRVYSTTYDHLDSILIKRSRIYEYGGSYEEFVENNHAPIHSFMVDVSKVDLDNLHYFEGQRYMEDYYLTLQIFGKENCDWESLAENHYIGDYIHSVNRSHTLAFSNDTERQALLKNPEYLMCEERIKNLRAKLA